MVDDTPHSLLQPSLGVRSLSRAPYTLRACIVAAFLGGPFAALGMVGLNAHRMGRLPRDLAWLLPALLAWVAFAWWWHATPAGRPFDQWLVEQAGNSGARYVERLAGLLGFGLGAWLHQREQRAADVMGLQRPNGWIGGSVVAVGGALLSLLLWWLGARVRGGA